MKFDSKLKTFVAAIPLVLAACSPLPAMANEKFCYLLGESTLKIIEGKTDEQSIAYFEQLVEETKDRLKGSVTIEASEHLLYFALNHRKVYKKPDALKPRVVMECKMFLMKNHPSMV